MSRGIQIYGGGWFYGDDIRHKFSAYCNECDMLFRRNSGYDGGDECPECKEYLTDAEDQQDTWDTFSGR